MGIDAEIYFESDGDPTDLVLPDGFELRKSSKEGATHYIYTLCRYYAPSYARGRWTDICAVLMSLFASTNVKRVWYFGDCSDLEDEGAITIDDVLKISRHYMLNGNRTYRDKTWIARS